MGEAALPLADDGLNTRTRAQIAEVLSRYLSVEQAVLYGSRALGRHRAGSDIDLALSGEVSLSTLNKIATDLDDLLLPWEIDLSSQADIENPDLLDHIARVGVVFYQR